MTGPKHAVWQQAIDALEQVRDASGIVVVAAHVNPDGDALGSLSAVHAGLVAGGWRSVPTWGNSTFRVPPDLEIIPGLADVVPPSQVPDNPALLVTVDIAAEGRLGMLRHLADGRCPILVLDHHASNTDFGDIRLVDPDAAGTVVVAAELLERLGVELSTESRTALHVGLLADTGGFLHSNTDAAALRLAADFVEAGVDHAGLATKLFATRSLAWLDVLRRVLDRLEFHDEVGLVASRITLDDLAETGTTFDALEGIIDVLRSAEEAHVTMLAKEHGEGRWSVSLRSDGSVDVTAIAAAWEGGGHARAAAFSTDDGPDEVAQKVAASLAALLAG
ncbi:MAG TPA: DHHA1 domain-containing protein [Nitriliruptorales bacterium]